MSKKKTELDESQRIERVLNASGMASRFAQHLPENYRKELAALCSADGQVKPSVRSLARSILHRCGQEQKATIDDGNGGDVLRAERGELQAIARKAYDELKGGN